MIDELAMLKSGAMISVDDEISKQFTGQEDFVINQVERYDVDGVDIAIAELGDYSLIVTYLSGSMICAICEGFGEEIDCFDSDDFADEIVLCGGEEDFVYQKGQAAYATSDTPSFCEYFTSDYHLDYLMVSEDSDCVNVYRGICVDEDSVIL